MQDGLSRHDSITASCIVQIAALEAKVNDSQQQTEQQLPALLPKPPQAATPAGSFSAAELFRRFSSKRLAAGTAECRICLSPGTAEQGLIQPCSCAGSMGYTHAACLEAWVQEKGSLTCELCKATYKEPYLQALTQAAAAGPRQKEATGAADNSEAQELNRWKLWLL